MTLPRSPLTVADPLPHRPRRILVTGCSGSGKTTLAAALATRLGVPHHELDALSHGPGWVPRPTFVADVIALAATESWVVEWQYTQLRYPAHVVRWAWGSFARIGPRVLVVLAQHDPCRRALRSRREIQRWLAQVA
jgi:broad-specificity NMP kinase